MPRLRRALRVLGWSLVILPLMGIIVSLYAMALLVAISWWAEGYYGTVGLLVAVVSALTGFVILSAIEEFWR